MHHSRHRHSSPPRHRHSSPPRYRHSSPPRQVIPVVPIPMISPISYNSQVFVPPNPFYSQIPLLRPIRSSFDQRSSFNLSSLSRLLRDKLLDVSVIFINPKGILFIKDNISNKWMIPLSSMNITESDDTSYLRIFIEKVGVSLDIKKITDNKNYIRRHRDGGITKVFIITSYQELPLSSNYNMVPIGNVVGLLRNIPYNRVNSLVENNKTLFNHLIDISELKLSTMKTEPPVETPVETPKTYTPDEIKEAILHIYMPHSDTDLSNLYKEFTTYREIKSIPPPIGSHITAPISDPVLQKALNIIYEKSPSIRDNIAGFRETYRRS
jgi:hypothetical protein